MEHTLGGDANSLGNTDKLSSAVTFCRARDSERTRNEFCTLPRWRDDDNAPTRDQTGRRVAATLWRDMWEIRGR